MMDWTDRHYRFMARQLSQKAVLYTEMIHARAIVHGDRSRFLDFHPEEQPLVLQLGGNEPEYLAQAARWAERWGYSEINLNCGCPSDKVASGSFGACLMADPSHVARLVESMKEAVSIPVTVKSRIGIESKGMSPLSDYDHLQHFTRTIVEAGCDRLIVHARIAVLGGLNPAENRTVPPLRYDDVYRLKEEFPDLPIELNGGLRTLDEMRKHLQGSLDGIMVGRSAYETPRILGSVDSLLDNGHAGLQATEFARETNTSSFESGELQGVSEAMTTSRVQESQRVLLSQVLEKMHGYILDRFDEGVPPARIVRHMLGLFHGIPGARRIRQSLSGKWYAGLENRILLGRYLAEVFAEVAEMDSANTAPQT